MQISIARRRITLLALLLLAASPGCSAGSREPAVGRASPRSVGNVLTAEEIQALPSANSIADLLQVMPGVFVRRGAPGGGSVQIQGREGPPLFVVNGVPQSNAGSAFGLNPRDIARIEIIKEGGASAQYGFLGSNGIILITTK